MKKQKNIKNCKNCTKYPECQKYQMFKEVDFKNPDQEQTEPSIEIAKTCEGYTDSRIKITKTEIKSLIDNFSFLTMRLNFKACKNPLIQVSVDDINKILTKLKNNLSEE